MSSASALWRLGLHRILLSQNLSTTTAGCRQLTSSNAGLTMDKEVATGVNIYIKGDDPRLGVDADYPDWLWSLAEPSKSFKILSREARTKGLADMADDDFFRFVKLKRKAQIKERNRRDAKK